MLKWLFPDTPVFSTNETDRHGIADILSKGALKHIISRPYHMQVSFDSRRSTLNDIFMEYDHPDIEYNRSNSANPTIIRSVSWEHDYRIVHLSQ